MRILLTGASGFVGSALGKELCARGHSVIALSRNPTEGKLKFPAEACSWENLNSLRDIDAVIHLAGENVAQRWSKRVKERILFSRVGTAEAILRAVPAWGGQKPKVYISASATGFYGDRGELTVNEDSIPGQDFLANICQAWEKSAHDMAPLVGRVVIFRFGMVLGIAGGALAKMLPAFRAGLGGRLGSGKQWVSWIHLEDLVLALLLALDSDNMKGVYNAVAPEPVRNSEFTEALALALGKKAMLPVPALALKLAMGEMAGILLGSQRVAPERLLAAGFGYRYPRIFGALESLVGK